MTTKSQKQVREYLERVTRLEDRILKLGGTIPPKWPWDFHGDLRATQLQEVVEELEAKERGETLKPV